MSDEQDGKSQVADASQQAVQGGLISHITDEDRMTSTCMRYLKIAQPCRPVVVNPTL